jgi:ubiquinone/menaquinone biosynthesis C-methylase UbiE
MTSPGRFRSHRIYASIYDRYNLGADLTWLGESRRLVLAQARGEVLEIGAGTGSNVELYRDVTRVVMSEPDPAFRRRLDNRVRWAEVPMEVCDAPAERLPFPDASFDTVISTLTMCTVDDPAQVAREVRRVLRPGGVFAMVEHIRNDRPRVAFWQDLAVPAWRFLIGGCRPNRPTLETIAGAGFEIRELCRYDPPHVPFVMFPYVVAVASTNLE